MKELDKIPWEDQNGMWSELADVCSIAALSPEERFAYEEELRNQWDLEATYLAKYQEGEDNGIEIGKEIGEDNKAREIARALIQKGMTNDFIVEITGLSIDEVQKLRAGKS